MTLLRTRATLLGLLALFLAIGPVQGDEDVPLPHDPSLVQGQLDNGLRYVLQRHANPAGRISLWLHVSSGSLNETEEQRGIAHYLEHMAFNGSKNFAPGTVIHYFESLGLSFGRDQNAFTSFDQTTYQLALPDTREETIAKGLLFLSDVALRLLLLPEEIESERQIILEEKRTRAGARQRVGEYVMERLAPESLFGRRAPIGIEETILSVKEKDFRAYWSKWYVPSNMTILGVGDCDMAPVVAAIAKAFADGPKVPPPADQDVGVKASTAPRAIVATDKELTAAELSIGRVEPARAPTRTEAAYRRDLLERVGTWVFNRRAGASVAAGEVAFLRGNASVNQMAGAIWTAQATATSAPDRWRQSLRDLARLLQQARKHGFSARELADARTALLADAAQRVATEATLPARALLFRMLMAVAAEEPILSAAQSQDLTARLLADITPAEVGKAFAEAFDPRHALFVLTLPEGPGVPTEEALVQAGREALEVPVQAPQEAARPERLLEERPEPGEIAAEGVHAASKVWSATFANGVRAHHLFNEERKNNVQVAITLAGGEIEETKARRGLTDAAALAWSNPATSKLTSTQIRDLMTGKRVDVSGSAGHDALTLTISGDPADLEVGLELAWLLLTDPHVEPQALERFTESRGQRIRASRLSPGGALRDALAEAFYPGVAQMQPVTEEDLGRLDAGKAEAWLRTLVGTAPIEVAVVGDLDRARARSLLATWLGSLPKRARIGPDTLAKARDVARPKGPIERRIEIPTETPQAFVMDGFFGADRKDVQDVRRLAVAARVLSSRMVDVLREEKRLVYSIGAASRPGEAYPGFGMFAAQAPTDPAKADALGLAITELYTAFAKDGPTDTEMSTVRKQLANTLDETMRTADFWLEQLSDLDYRGRSLDDVLGMPAAYEALTAKEVKEAFARYFVPEARFRFVVVPAGGPREAHPGTDEGE